MALSRGRGVLQDAALKNKRGFVVRASDYFPVVHIELSPAEFHALKKNPLIGRGAFDYEDGADGAIDDRGILIPKWPARPRYARLPRQELDIAEDGVR
jgi:hypothetical protein